MNATQLDEAAAASATALREQLRDVQQLLCEMNRAQEVQAQLNKVPGKYQTHKMEVGSITDFHNGLTDRIGACATAAALPLLF